MQRPLTANGPDPRKFWNTIKNNGKQEYEPCDGFVVIIKSKMADHFNRHLAKAGCAYEDNTSTCSSVNLAFVTHSSPSGFPSFSFQSIQESEVLGELLHLEIHKSAGLDALDPQFLKTTAHVIAAPITCSFNLSLQTDVFPRDRKSAAVTRLFKGGDNSDLNCNRLISILPGLFQNTGETDQQEAYVPPGDLVYP